MRSKLLLVIAMLVFAAPAVAQEWIPIRLGEGQLAYVGDDNLIDGIVVAKMERVVDASGVRRYGEYWGFRRGFINYGKTILSANWEFSPGRARKKDIAELFTTLLEDTKRGPIGVGDLSRSGRFYSVVTELSGQDCVMFYKSLRDGEEIFGEVCSSGGDQGDAIAGVLGAIQRGGRDLFKASEVSGR